MNSPGTLLPLLNYIYLKNIKISLEFVLFHVLAHILISQVKDQVRYFQF